MNVDLKHGNEQSAVTLSGELSIYDAAAMRDALLGALAASRAVEVDLSGVETIDTAALQVLVAAKRQATQENRNLRLARHSPAVLDALELTGLTAYFGDPLVLTA